MRASIRRISSLQSTMTSPQTLPISALPLPPSSHILTRNLTPDPETSSPSEFAKVLREGPSVQRRSRLLADNAHFSYVTPCPLQFPFRIEPPEDGGPVEDKVAYVEQWLAQREALNERPSASSAAPSVLKKYYAGRRDEPRVLVALAETALNDCLPHLDVGDAFSTLGTPSLSDAYGDDTKPEPASEGALAVRQELIDVLGGQAVLMNLDGEQETQWAPWALRYSGHQFGTFAGQLGDGRAISILSTPHPSDPDTTYELQLKGAGRTPFSRFADGLAVLRSSIREFLCSEAMHALGIPTTRALALVQLPALPVQRERRETACVLTRAAPSFVRIGSFEALNPPTAGIGVAQQEADWEALRVLGEWVGKRVLKLEGVQWGGEGEGSKWGEKLVLESARRNGKMVAAWQAYGFMHGVINTDNVSVLGLTIDYGPYAFMDVFDAWHICNHDDGEGRYGYKWQPNAVIFALRALATSLAPLIGAEAELGHAVSAGWANEDKIDDWRKTGTELVKDEMERVAQDACAQEYGRLIHKRLGLRRHDPSDEAELCRPLLDLLGEHKFDFHGTFRALGAFRPGADEPAQNVFVDRLLALCGTPHNLDMAKAVDDWRAWLRKYGARIESERGEWGEVGDVDAERMREMRGANPRFVLRQWVLEEVIKHVERDVDSGKRLLAKVLQMACNPFEPWGGEDHEGDEATLDPELKEERRFCSLGDMNYLGYQCSCSS
ncbi:uncharacterized protein C8Q71DRAFT_528109 [Rhodofomes roseus]|uniref:Selenoprotein O n=1 Tax=Rhodofomes roseus TaxID=34475 RepID=A0ABQ8KJS6_9APHY|nr:uncharacterized protein C8Q71DRAFT_528109 [Rhodofomes roseus]KAH9838403.1 hypothetical protein C8Q71DRAFT_528109 [Rhodofomes roseus]